MWTHLGRQTAEVDWNGWPDAISVHTFIRRFGTWRSALQNFEAWAQFQVQPRRSHSAPTTHRERGRFGTTDSKISQLGLRHRVWQEINSGAAVRAIRQSNSRGRAPRGSHQAVDLGGKTVMENTDVYAGIVIGGKGAEM